MGRRGAPLLLGERVTIHRPHVVVGNPGGLRVRLLCEALAERGRRSPRVIPYSDLLTGRCGLEQVPPRSIVRFESPGKDFQTERLLLARGASEAESEGSPVISAPDAEHMAFDRGRIWFPRQWYLGFRNALREWHTELQTRDDVLLTAWPPDVETLFDKRRCHARCQGAGVSVPQALRPVACYDDLVAQMQQRHWERVFVKLAHGSSASGAVALQRHRGRVAAFTTVEVAGDDGQPRLYNTRPVRTTTCEDEVRRLIDALALHRLHTEQWLPKATLDHRVFDLRIVVIADRPRHTVVRQGKSPITNLQLGNSRGSLVGLQERLAPRAWHTLQATCSQVARLHPRSLHLGLDLLLTPGLRDHFVLEVNAFGDLLRGVLHEGRSTFEAELDALETGWVPCDDDAPGGSPEPPHHSAGLTHARPACNPGRGAG